MQQLGTGFQRAAKTSRIVIQGSSPLCYTSWNCNEETDDLPTENFESYNVAAGESFKEGLHAAIGVRFDAGGDWDAGLAPYGSPPGLYIRDDLQNVQFLPSRIDNVPWTFAYQRVRSSTNGAEMKGNVTFKWSGMSQGPYTKPTTSV